MKTSPKSSRKSEVPGSEVEHLFTEKRTSDMQKKLNDTRELPLDVKLSLFIKMCQGVKTLHENGIIHRDVKPQNYLIDLDIAHPANSVVQLMDFGASASYNEEIVGVDNVTMEGERLPQDRNNPLGTAGYVDMTAVMNGITSLKEGKEADIYSLAITLYSFSQERLRTKMGGLNSPIPSNYCHFLGSLQMIPTSQSVSESLNPSFGMKDEEIEKTSDLLISMLMPTNLVADGPTIDDIIESTQMIIGASPNP